MGERNGSRDRVGKISSKSVRMKINSRNVEVRKYKEMNLSSKQQDAVMDRQWCVPSTSRRVDLALSNLSTYDLHKRLINDYILTRKGATCALSRDTSGDRRDADLIREHHQFLWDDNTSTDCWEARLAKKYYDKLFKEYCICDLSRYKEKKVGMRWRTQGEVVEGKGQFSCAEKRCGERDGLHSWEVNFGYVEHGIKKNALVKVRVCAACSERLNHVQRRREVTRTARGSRRRVEAGAASQEEQQQDEREDERKDERADEAWRRGAGPAPEERSRDDLFQDYLEQLLL